MTLSRSRGSLCSIAWVARSGTVPKSQGIITAEKFRFHEFELKIIHIWLMTSPGPHGKVWGVNKARYRSQQSWDLSHMWPWSCKGATGADPTEAEGQALWSSFAQGKSWWPGLAHLRNRPCGAPWLSGSHGGQGWAHVRCSQGWTCSRVRAPWGWPGQ